jgi:hypothetical protein
VSAREESDEAGRNIVELAQKEQRLSVFPTAVSFGSFDDGGPRLGYEWVLGVRSGVVLSSTFSSDELFFVHVPAESRTDRGHGSWRSQNFCKINFKLRRVQIQNIAECFYRPVFTVFYCKKEKVIEDVRC